LGFTFLFLLISLYLLPSISAILKVRKRKLAQFGSSSSTTEVTTSATSIINNANLAVVIDSTVAYANSELLNTSGAQSSFLADSNAIIIQEECKSSFSFKLRRYIFSLVFI